MRARLLLKTICIDLLLTGLLLVIWQNSTFCKSTGEEFIKKMKLYKILTREHNHIKCVSRRQLFAMIQQLTQNTNPNTK